MTSPRESPADAAALVAERIHRNGPIRFGEYVEHALYGPGGFFSSGGGAGRAGRDFLTSPEVGPLFGVCVARALDREWERLGRPDPFVVVEAGAGSGRLAREVLRAEPACRQALHYVLVERSDVLRAEQAERLALEPLSDTLGPAVRVPDEESPIAVPGSGPIVSSLAELPARSFDGVVLANELLDNLTFEIGVRSARGWDEVRVGVDPDGRLVEVLVPASDAVGSWLAGLDVPIGVRVPVALGAVDWIVDAAARLRRGSLVLLDYVASWAELVDRRGGWLRTFAAHARGADPLLGPGTQDITIDVPREMIRHAATRAGLGTVEQSQAAWLKAVGIEALVDEGRRSWEAGAGAPDLAALIGRSRIAEAAALTDPAGLGAHTVVTLTRP